MNHMAPHLPLPARCCRLARRWLPILLLVSVVAPAAAQPAEGNWVQNGTFAIDLEHWSTEGSITWDGVGSPTPGSMRVASQPANPASPRAWQCIQAPLPAGRRFQLSAQVLNSFFNHRVNARAWDQDDCQGAALANVSAPIVSTGPDGWALVQAGPIDFPVATQSIEIEIGVHSGTIWVDSVEFGAVREYVTVTGGPGNDRQPSVAIPWTQPDSRIAIFARLGGPQNGALYGTRSDDTGTSWSEPFVALDSQEHEVTPSLVQTDAAAWSLFHHRWSASRFFRQTSSDGMTFGQPELVELGWVLPVSLKEPHVVRGGDGALTLIYNCCGGGLGGSRFEAAYIARSLDNGASWDALLTEAARDNSGLRQPRLAQRASDGVWLLTYVTGQIPVVGPIEPGTIWLKQAVDPYDWSAPAVRLTPDDGVDNIHPSPLVLADGSFVVAWARDVDGAFQVFAIRSLDGVTWQSPMQLTERAGLHNIDPLAVAGAQPGTIDLYWSAGQAPGFDDFDIALMAGIDVVDFLFIDAFESP